MKARQIPNNLEAERCVLAGMMLDPAAILKVLDTLSADGNEFYHPAHKRIFKSMTALHEKGKPVDVITVLDALSGTDTLSTLGGPSYLAVMTEALPTTANIGYYAKAVKEKALRRRVIVEAQELAQEAFEEGSITTDELIESAQKRFIGLDTGEKKPFHPIRRLLKEGFDEFERLHREKGSITGLKTGFHTLDFILGGLQKTDLIIIAGRPSMGKSSLCCQIATEMAKEGKRVGYFSIEVGRGQVIKNIFAAQGEINTIRFRGGDFTEEEWGGVSRTMNELIETTFSIDDQSRTSQDVVRQARRMKLEHGLDIVFIDHIQEMREKGRHENRNQEVDLIASALKALAKELDIPVVVVAQLSRKVEDRGGDFKPRLSDLRDSGSLEQKADVIMFVYREDYYFKEASEHPEEAQVMIAKHRNGATGDVKFRWKKEYVRFDEF